MATTHRHKLHRAKLDEPRDEPEPVVDTRVKRGAISALYKGGYGYITGTDGVDRFFHRSAVEPDSMVQFHDMQRNQRVTFEDELPTPPKGPRANNVRVVM